MGYTISMSVGRVAILHDIRKDISANVDVDLIGRDEIMVDKLAGYNYSVEAYTNAKYQPVLDEYNNRQTRPERMKMKPYTEYIKEENDKLLKKAEDNKKAGIQTATRKPTKLVHEYVLQFGDRESNSTLTADNELCKSYYRAVIEDFQQKYPHCDILLATYHADEPNGTPHVHILVQFDGEGYTKGLSKQISMSKALECDGFERLQVRGNYAINRWTQDVQDTIMTERLHDIVHADREVIGDHRKHEETAIFRAKAKAEAEALKDIRAESAELSQEIEKKEIVRDRINQDVADKIDEFNKLYDDSEDLKKELKTLNTSKSSLNADIADLHKKRGKTANELIKLENERDTLSKYDDMSKLLTEIDTPELIQTRKGVLIRGADVESVEAVFKSAALVEGATNKANSIIDNAQRHVAAADAIMQNQKKIIDEANQKAATIVQNAQKRAESLKGDILSLNRQKTDLEADNEKIQQKMQTAQTAIRAYENGWTDQNGNQHKGYKTIKAELDKAKSDLSDTQYILDELTEMTAHPDEIDEKITKKVVERLTREAITETVRVLDEGGKLSTNHLDAQSTAFLQLPALSERVREKVQPLIDKPAELVQDVTRIYHHSR
jgi:vacuolar-type H+-ATPase subunit H